MYGALLLIVCGMEKELHVGAIMYTVTMFLPGLRQRARRIYCT